MDEKILIQSVENKIMDMKEFSGVIKIRKSDKVIFEKAYGFADIPNERPNNINTRFGIASGAKLLTSIAICKLVEEGKLKFDTLLKDYLDYDNFDENVTIRDMLTHTSGLPDYYDEDVMEDFSEIWINNPMYLMKEPNDFFPLIKNQKTMFKPGEKFHYNNGAFVILAYIVERVSGVKFIDYVKENIFDILNMDSSGYFSMDMLPKNCAYGYIGEEGDMLKTNIYSVPIVGGGDGGVYVTSEDISKLWDGLLNYKLLSKEITEELLTPYVYDNYDVYYGYGIWIIKRDDKIYKYYIVGEDPGVSFESSYFVHEELEVTILGNREFETFDIIQVIEKNI